MYTLRQAAKATGKAPNTIRNAIKRGRISASQDDAGHFKITPSELHRVYPAVNAQPVDGVQLHSLDSPSEHPQKASISDTEREGYEARIAMLEQTLERERENADEWRKQAQTLALAAPSAHEAPSAGQAKKSGIKAAWSALLGK